MHAGEEFALDLFGGFTGGLVMGVLAWGLLELIRRTGLDTPTLHVMLELLLPFVIYLTAIVGERRHRHGIGGAHGRAERAGRRKRNRRRVLACARGRGIRA